MSDLVTRQILNGWICNDGLEHLFEEGYLSPELIDPADPDLRNAVRYAYEDWRDYEQSAQVVQDLVDEALDG